MEKTLGEIIRYNPNLLKNSTNHNDINKRVYKREYFTHQIKKDTLQRQHQAWLTSQLTRPKNNRKTGTKITGRTWQDSEIGWGPFSWASPCGSRTGTLAQQFLLQLGLQLCLQLHDCGCSLGSTWLSWAPFHMATALSLFPLFLFFSQSSILDSLALIYRTKPEKPQLRERGKGPWWQRGASSTRLTPKPVHPWAQAQQKMVTLPAPASCCWTHAPAMMWMVKN